MSRIHKIKFEGQSENFIINDANEDAENAFAYGDGAEALAPASSAFGVGTQASTEGAHVTGTYNLIDNEHKYLHIVGNGSSDIRSNAHTLDKNGNAWFSGNISGQINGEEISLASLKNLCNTLHNYISTVEKNFSETVIDSLGLVCEENGGIISFAIIPNEQGEE